MQCPSCDRDNPGDAAFCMSCGSKLAPVCQECARELPPGAAFCPSCGTPVAGEAAPSSSPSSQPADASSGESSIEHVASAVYADKPDLRSKASPDGAVTLLFSDIEGSTEKTEKLGDRRWLEVLTEHNAIVREQLAAHGGFEVKADGDGFMLAFQSARSAIQCAIETQRAFATRNESSAEPFRVRMGLHTGEVIKVGDDFFGKHVILAARVAAAARGGEILVSALLKDLTSSSDEIEFGEARDLELKGLAGTQRAFLIVWE